MRRTASTRIVVAAVLACVVATIPGGASADERAKDELSTSVCGSGVQYCTDDGGHIAQTVVGYVFRGGFYCVYTYRYEFGDGASETVTYDELGNEIEWSHTYAERGKYPLSVTVVEGHPGAGATVPAGTCERNNGKSIELGTVEYPEAAKKGDKVKFAGTPSKVKKKAGTFQLIQFELNPPRIFQFATTKSTKWSGLEDIGDIGNHGDELDVTGRFDGKGWVALKVKAKKGGSDD